MRLQRRGKKIEPKQITPYDLIGLNSIATFKEKIEWNVRLNVSLDELPNSYIIYDYSYDHDTITEELRELAIQYSNEQIIVGAISGKESTSLALAAMGPGNILKLDTPQNQPVNKNPSDDEDDDGVKPLSWHLDRCSGDWRAENTKGLRRNNEWRKVILAEN
ncbi:unnamed protein product [Didymodactylos carnosus]|uniref:Uncharacterized protein n=1 Tax=Didymodactylos carnosus TaxID=1234261 RepID=A0A816BXG6_9BILA|nr:unnamed protein product [Didymodactylos carnosus]CAF1613220.1 unnamed protein product [Didymodactylos carnosus]CAF4219754.1 unnamed protein product [Didymodactylos carnosus]CAF4497908.1 unnamed protein product [Didymodactylos carnosus]